MGWVLNDKVSEGRYVRFRSVPTLKAGVRHEKVVRHIHQANVVVERNDGQ